MAGAGDNNLVYGCITQKYSFDKENNQCIKNYKGEYETLESCMKNAPFKTWNYLKDWECKKISPSISGKKWMEMPMYVTKSECVNASENITKCS